MTAITQYPRFGCGVVEGFYGRPWTFRERAAILDVLSAPQLDVFVVAPKDDSWHRNWARPFDSATAQHWESLCELGLAQSVRLVFGLQMTKSIPFPLLRRDLGQLRQKLAQKARELAQLGCHEISLGFDDTLPTLFPSLLSRSGGLLHAELANVIVDAVPQARVLVVPALYFGNPQRLSSTTLAYFEALATSRANPYCAWTGRSILSRWISAHDIDQLQDRLGIPIVVWDNEIANDWLPLLTGERFGLTPWTMLSFPPVTALAPDLPHAASGLLLNGAREPWLTRVSTRTLAQFLQAPRRYNCRQAHRTALAEEFGSDAVDEMSLLFDIFSYRQTPVGHMAVFESHSAKRAALRQVAAQLRKTLVKHPALDDLRSRLELLDRMAEDPKAGREERVFFVTPPVRHRSRNGPPQ